MISHEEDRKTEHKLIGFFKKKKISFGSKDEEEDRTQTSSLLVFASKK